MARWLLVGILAAVLLAWATLSHQIGSSAQETQASVESGTSSIPAPGSDPVQCWMFGISIQGDQAKIDTLSKNTDSTCVQQALQGARGESYTN